MSTKTPSPPLTFTIDPALTPFDVPVQEFLTKYGFRGMVVAGAVIIQNRLLLIKRASHDWCPDKWELPGGSADPLPGVRIIDEAARELWEETGLRATAARALVGTYTWGRAGVGTQIRSLAVDLDESRRERNIIEARVFKATFLFEVEEGDVLLDPEEHQEYVWATEDEAREDRCGDVEIVWTFAAQKANALEAFEVYKSGGKEGKV